MAFLVLAEVAQPVLRPALSERVDIDSTDTSMKTEITVLASHNVAYVVTFLETTHTLRELSVRMPLREEVLSSLPRFKGNISLRGMSQKRRQKY